MRGLPLSQRCSAVLAIGVLPFAAPSAGAQSAPSLAVEVKAAYLDKLGDFVDWPASAFSNPGEPLKLCVAGTDPFGPLLDQATEGKRIDGHPIALVRLDRIERGATCHILFAGGSQKQSVAEALDRVRGAPVLTVTDDSSEPGARGMVNFVMRDNRIRFEIDADSATQSGLAISSKLLRLAVRPEE